MTGELLQAFIDESINGSRPRLLVYGGYVAPPQRWEKFSGEWQRCLDQAPPLRYFKMREAMNLNTQFGKHKFDRDTADRRVEQLHAISGRYVAGAIWVALNLDDFDRVFASRPDVPMRMRNPFFYAMFGLIHHLARFSHLIGLDGKIDFLFDDQARGRKQITEAWDSFKNFAPVPTTRLGEAPTFGDDKALKPLQAADMLAWIIRQKVVSHVNREPQPRLPWENERADTHPGCRTIGALIGEKELLAHIARAPTRMDELIRGEFAYLKGQNRSIA